MRKLGSIVAGVAFFLGVITVVGEAGTTPTIRVLSNRADLISGGDALVEILGADPGSMVVTAGARDVTSAFALRANGRVQGLLTDLPTGPTLVRVFSNGSGASLTVDNHPIGGPVFAGPQVRPWICRTGAAGLGSPRDAQCNAATKVEYFYISTRPDKPGFRPYDPEAPPTQVATTTTDEGVTVPFIVRRERGVIDRGVYDIAVLFDPAQPWKPWSPQPGWNGKLYWGFAGGCAPGHEQPTPDDNKSFKVLDEEGLSRGFMTSSSGMTIPGRTCNPVVAAETVLMMKEHIVEAYGPIRYTIAKGCSGGSILQHFMVSAYPGLLDGILPSCSFPDVWGPVLEAEDCYLLEPVFRAAPDRWTEGKQNAVTGYATASACGSWRPYAKTFLDPTNAPGCRLPSKQVYSRGSNPDGVRCTIADYLIGVYGARSQDGFAARAFDNVGVQYGLQALEDGEITPDDFVVLNERVGGLDIDWHRVPGRSTADVAALEAAYRSGLVLTPREAAKVPIIDLRGWSSNIGGHTSFHSAEMKARLVAANGDADNQIIWRSGQPLDGDPAVAAEAFDLLDRWLSNIEADTSGDPLETKVVTNKPAGATDACWIRDTRINDQTQCEMVYPDFADPRMAAGGPFEGGILKCRLKPLSPGDYGVEFTLQQWARLQAVFPNGVCDYTSPGVAQQPIVPWMTFAGGPGGEPLGPPPVSQPF